MSGSNLVSQWISALLLGNKDVIQKLLDDGAINVVNNQGLTPLHMVALKDKNNNLLKELIAKGADVNAKNNNGWTPLLQAASTAEGTKNVVTLLAAGADPNATLPDKVNPLYLAAYFKENTPIAEPLLAAGADVNIIGPLGLTPLHLAVINKRTELVKILLEGGADISITDNKEQTALDYVNNKKIRDIFKKFVKNKKLKRGQNLMMSLYQNKRLPANILKKIGEMNTEGVGKAMNVVNNIYKRQDEKQQMAAKNHNAPGLEAVENNAGNETHMPGLEPIPSNETQKPGVSYAENVDGGRRKRKTRKGKSRKYRTRKHK